jgi:hypothetical protein
MDSSGGDPTEDPTDVNIKAIDLGSEEDVARL